MLRQQRFEKTGLEDDFAYFKMFVDEMNRQELHKDPNYTAITFDNIAYGERSSTRTLLGRMQKVYDFVKAEFSRLNNL
jgi:hypothetical protein